jgi:hypothetical protein
MIIKGKRVKTSRAMAPLIRHLLSGEENEAVTVVRGTEDDIRSAFADARALDRNFSIRHFIISPAVETSDEDAEMVLGLLGREFIFDPATAFLVKHEKPRAVASAFGSHWHAIVPEQNAATGRTLSSKFSYLRHQKISCVAAYRLGHPMVPLAHTSAVMNALESDGHLEIVAALRTATEDQAQERPREAFSTDIHQRGKRLGADIPAARAAVRAAWETTFDRETLEVALAKNQLRIRAGDKPETFIVETLTGVFVGAAHRLARVRRTDFLARITGDQNVRNQSAEQREAVPRTATRGNPIHQGTLGQTGSTRSRRFSGAGGSIADIAGVDFDNPARSADQSRGPAPAHRRHCSLRARGSARRFRQALNRNPSRLEKIIRQARHLARPPVERVAIQLNNFEDRLQGQIKAILSRPPPGAALAAAQRDAKHLSVRIDKYDNAIAAARAHARAVAEKEPGGLHSRIDGSRRRWQQRLSAAETRCTALVEKHSGLCVRLRRVRDSIADLDKSEVQQHSRALRSAENAARLAQLRDQIEHVGRCRAQLNIAPAIAWGGVLMTLGVMSAIEEIKSLIESESGPSTIPVLVTDIWGVGLRNSPM